MVDSPMLQSTEKPLLMTAVPPPIFMVDAVDWPGDLNAKTKRKAGRIILIVNGYGLRRRSYPLYTRQDIVP